jgi:hypothetical protein
MTFPPETYLDWFSFDFYYGFKQSCNTDTFYVLKQDVMLLINQKLRTRGWYCFQLHINNRCYLGSVWLLCRVKYVGDIRDMLELWGWNGHVNNNNMAEALKWEYTWNSITSQQQHNSAAFLSSSCLPQAFYAKNDWLESTHHGPRDHKCIFNLILDLWVRLNFNRDKYSIILSCYLSSLMSPVKFSFSKNNNLTSP